MNRDLEIELLQELLALHSKKEAFLDHSVVHSKKERYTDSKRFQIEQSQILAKLTQPLVHTSELPKSGSFLRRELAGLPLLITRDEKGIAHVFLNVCRHRGTRLVDDHSGCKKRFSCPYHAWTWNNSGELISIPHQKQGFPDLDNSTMGLKVLGSIERYGWIWVNPESPSLPDLDKSIGELGLDLEWFDTKSLTLLHSDEKVWPINWKILAEGGLESYHFRVAHQNTVGPYFIDNLSTYKEFGRYIRSVIAKRSLVELTSLPKSNWNLRNHAQVLYTLLPTTALLVQADHVAWIRFEPLAENSTKIWINTLVPSNETRSATALDHWKKNHEITVNTLTEDFLIGETIQAGLESGANEWLTFGRFEGALAQYNKMVDNLLV